MFVVLHCLNLPCFCKTQLNNIKRKKAQSIWTCWCALSWHIYCFWIRIISGSSASHDFCNGCEQFSVMSASGRQITVIWEICSCIGWLMSLHKLNAEQWECSYKKFTYNLFSFKTVVVIHRTHVHVQFHFDLCKTLQFRTKWGKLQKSAFFKNLSISWKILKLWFLQISANPPFWLSEVEVYTIQTEMVC